MKGAIEWCSRNHVAGNFLMVALLLAGFTTWFTLKKEIFPETSVDALVVQVPYPNATPEEVERGICVPVEEAVADLEGIKKIRSTASENVGVVTVEAKTGFDVRTLMDDVKTRVDAIDNFPEEAEKPVIEEILIKSPVMSVAISAEMDETGLRKLADEVREDLLNYKLGPPDHLAELLAKFMRGEDTITQVELAGVKPFEISLEIPEVKLRELGLTLSQVAQRVRETSVDLPGGSVRTEGGEIVLRATGKRYRAADFANIPVASRPDGSEVLLGEIATLLDGFEDVDLASKYDGRDAVLVNVYRVGQEDTTALAKMVRNYVAEKNETLPKGVQLAIWNDQSVFLEGRLQLLARNASTGLLLVLIVLALFLRPSLAFLVALGIPVSFAGGIWLMPVMGISVNMISLFAFILVLGIVVDDAIVTGENVYARIQHGEHPMHAAPRGTHEVGTVVVFGVLTTAVAFTPMLGLSGVSGKIWPNIPLVVIPTLMFSLVQSKFVLPAHLSLLAPTDHSRKIRNPLTLLQRKVAGGLEWFVEHIYWPVLSVILRWRYVSIGVFICLFVGTLGVVAMGYVKSQFFPEVEGDVLSAKVELVQGVPFSETQDVVNEIADAIREVGQEVRDDAGNSVVKHLLASAGSQPFQTGFSPDGPPTATHLGEVTVELVPAATRAAGADDLVQRWRERLGEIPGVASLTIRSETGASGNAIDVNLTGNKLERLDEATEWVKEGLREYPGVIEIADSNRTGKDEIRFTKLTPAGRAMGLSLGAVAAQVRDAFYGNEVQRLQRGRDEVKVMVRYPEQERKTIESLEEMKIVTPSGERVPLPQVVAYDFAQGTSTIQRTDRQRSIKITADVDANTNANEVMAKFVPDVLEQVSLKFPGVRYDFEGEQKDQNDSVREIGIKFLFALVMMYVLIAIPLKSYFQPLIIMSVIPFGIVGAVWGHVLFGMNLSIMSMCGLVALAGVVVNDSLVLVDFVNRYRAAGHSVVEAAEAAGRRRFRAILLTSLTTFAGLMPMLVEQDIQARFLIPMAVSLGFGILFATLITLVLVPCIYLVMEDAAHLIQAPSRLLSSKSKQGHPSEKSSAERFV